MRFANRAIGRRMAVSVVAVGLVAAAEVAATLSATVAQAPTSQRSVHVVAHVSPPPASGEPQLPESSSILAAPRSAAVRFVRDYALWSSGRLVAIPDEDATRRVIGLLARAGRHAGVRAREAVASVRIAPAGARRFVVTSAVGNFLVGQGGSRWLVVSLPGD